MSDIIKPVSVVRAEFIDELTNLINNSKLPLFIIEPILKDAYNETRILSQRQLEADMKKYYDALNAESKEGDSNVGVK